MDPEASEKVTVREGGAKSGSQFDQNPTGGSGDYSTRGDYGSAKYKLNRGDRDTFDRRDYKREGERRPSMDRVRMNCEGERPYGHPKGLLENKRFDSRVKEFGNGPERHYGYGRMAPVSPVGSPSRFGSGGDYDRYDYQPEFSGRFPYETESVRSDYGRSPFGRGGYWDYYGRYGPERGFGREYGYGSGYGARYGNEQGSRMNSYGYARQHGSHRASRTGAFGYGANYGHGYAKHSQGYGEQSQRGSSYRPGYDRYGRDYGKFGEQSKDYDFGKDGRDRNPSGNSKYGYGEGKPRGHSPDSVSSGGQSQCSASPHDPTKYNRGNLRPGGDRKEAESRKVHREVSPRQSVSEHHTYESSPYPYGSSTHGQGYGPGEIGPYHPREYERSSYRRYPFDSARFSDGSRQRSGGHGGQLGYRAQYGFGGRQRDYGRNHPRFDGFYGAGSPFKGNQFGGYGGDFFGPPPPFESFQQHRTPPPYPFVRS